MTPELVSHLLNQALWATFWLCAPLLAIGFIVGLIVNLIQIATSLQDSSFSTIPRLCAFLLGLVLLMPWMLSRMMSYTVAMLGDFSRYAR
jgi:flagellar biosynthetic protein FliQ